MLLREPWRGSDEDALALIEAHPWALVLCNGPDVPFVTATPVMLDRTRGPKGTLVAHIGRANPQARHLRDGTPALVLFQGPSAYVSPSWYPNRDMAPTVYYTMVEATGRVRIQEPTPMRASVQALTDAYERDVPEGWRMDELPEEGIRRRMAMIHGFEIEVEALQAKLKLGQDEPRKDPLAVAERLAASPKQDKRAFADVVRAHNVGRSEG